MTQQPNPDLLGIKAILIDVDGTLVKSDRTISAYVAEKIEEAREKGLIVGLCTGRQISTLKTVFDHIQHQGTHVVAGGARVVEAGNPINILWENLIKSEDAKWLVDNVQSMGGDVVLGKTDGVYGYDSFVKKIAEHPWEIPVFHLDQLPEDWSTGLISIHQINPEIEEFLNNQDKVHVVRMASRYSGYVYYDATAHGVSKLKGVQEWAKLLEIDLEQVMGIGDGMNDAEYLAEVGVAVAMDNAEEAVKDLAQYMVASNDEDGVAQAIDLVLNNNKI